MAHNMPIEEQEDCPMKYSNYLLALLLSAGDSLLADRIQQDVDAQLAAKRWTKVAANGNASISAFEAVGA